MYTLKNLLRKVDKLCSPAHLYLVVSVFFLLVAMVQNYGLDKELCLGSYSCAVSNTGGIFVGQLLYVIFWTFILNTLCKAGYKKIAWLIILLPFLISLALLVLLFTRQ